MKSVLLVVGGVIQLLVVALHVSIFFGIAAAPELSPRMKEGTHIFNAAVLTTVAFFAYASLFRRREMAHTPFGRAVSLFIAVFYLQRGLVALYLRGFDPVTLALSLGIASLYIVAALPDRRPGAFVEAPVVGGGVNGLARR